MENVLPQEPFLRINQTCVFHQKTLIIIMDRLAICFEGHWAIAVPFEHQLPEVGIILPKQTQLVCALVMTEPAASTRSICIDRRQEIVLFAPLPTVRFCPADNSERRNLRYTIQTGEPLGFIEGNTNILYTPPEYFLYID